jgi:hypothetical protein
VTKIIVSQDEVLYSLSFALIFKNVLHCLLSSFIPGANMDLCKLYDLSLTFLVDPVPLHLHYPERDYELSHYFDPFYRGDFVVRVWMIITNVRELLNSCTPIPFEAGTALVSMIL